MNSISERINLSVQLKKKIDDSKEYDENPNSIDWGMQEGVLITANQAELFLMLLHQSLHTESYEDTQKAELVHLVAQAQDRIVLQTCIELLERSKVGVEKYGTTLEDYLKRLKSEL